MPDLSILGPQVATGVVQDLTPDENFTWYGKVGTLPLTQSQSVTYDVHKNGQKMAKMNVIDAEANLVKRSGKTRNTLTLATIREKELVPGSEYNFTQVFENNEAQRQRAEGVAGDVLKNLNDRVGRRVEWTFWNALQGGVVYDTPDVSVDLDYKIPSTHKITASTHWDTATQIQLVDQVNAVKKLIKTDGKVALTDAYTSLEVIQMIYGAFAKNNALNLLTEQNKADYQNGGTFSNFLGINWHIVDETYQTDADADTNYLPENRILFGNFTQNNPLRLAEGTSGDTQIPQDTVGRFSKSWDTPDPSGRTFLVGYNFAPIIYFPNQFAYMDVL